VNFQEARDCVDLELELMPVALKSAKQGGKRYENTDVDVCPDPRQKTSVLLCKRYVEHS